ncbi:uncharacterized protein HKW66_Vig0239010 [Vigna angularis]|uniref:Uncharacterized protein n=1 Tax=Phaseolus angularis TaxID=3914 RepID=A0A8T0KSM0_PHAAN|nr:uncharacterized protein HKW66_Vig0239010 [Vigna angularis]
MQPNTLESNMNMMEPNMEIIEKHGNRISPLGTEFILRNASLLELNTATRKGAYPDYRRIKEAPPTNDHCTHRRIALPNDHCTYRRTAVSPYHEHPHYHTTNQNQNGEEVEMDMEKERK